MRQNQMVKHPYIVVVPVEMQIIPMCNLLSVKPGWLILQALAGKGRRFRHTHAFDESPIC